MTPATIERIETIPIRVPLGQTYSGSYYQMTHRSTIVTRVTTSDGLVGEAYGGDEDADRSAPSRRSSTREIAPRVIGEELFAIERVWELARPGDVRQLRDRGSAWWRPPGRHRGLGRRRQGASASPPMAALGRLPRRLPMIRSAATTSTGDALAEEAGRARAGLAGMKFKVGGLSPEEDAERFHAARAAGRRRFVLWSTPTRAGTPATRSGSPGWSPTSTSTGSRSPAAGTTTAARCATSATRRGIPRLRRPERVLGGRVPRPDGRAGRSTSATSTPPGRAARPSGAGWRRSRVRVRRTRWPTTRSRRSRATCSPRSRTARSSRCSTPARDPIWWNLIAQPPADRRRAHRRCPTAPGLGWELDWEYIDAHRVAVS